MITIDDGYMFYLFYMIIVQGLFARCSCTQARLRWADLRITDEGRVPKRGEAGFVGCPELPLATCRM